MWSIARRFNTTVNDLRSANNLTSDLLRVGQILVIPTGNVTGNITYTVQRGDTLYGLAGRYNTTVNDIIQANNLTSDVLYIGQTLTIPGSNIDSGNAPSYYTVQRGDTLWNIANRFNTTVSEIQRLNNLTNTVLQIGQQLLIPGNNSTETIETYIVQPGDSLYQIANQFNTTVNELITLNNLTSTLLQIGQVLRIPV